MTLRDDLTATTRTLQSHPKIFRSEFPNSPLPIATASCTDHPPLPLPQSHLSLTHSLAPEVLIPAAPPLPRFDSKSHTAGMIAATYTSHLQGRGCISFPTKCRGVGRHVCFSSNWVRVPTLRLAFPRGRVWPRVRV
ncbi:hypothetical protein HBH56_199980 [Parastagonospora nodorum]|uniref:Uncharacterized protein n=1 Tax=Phaeosphaeria nodorum (strain SN15 / ATCC MYA-4574 / FGSC 10173) TaxID=321614 RepID=A0A7U2F8K2_PHANO|nr:hypothetical protein HBH56_199980 [Parastagonospora nodorum]QRD00743.1 hypothetical protein JI435_415720 [Parastagonospora nodorum SN15]KAH3925873.1 hypothetical protein HBH54_176320 [Parastagonospora nodorum]KAH4000664.1 hypothetical protein HBI10_100620 [Parastagonospora nodorum]KAH4026653.1 hypothetical protein HBI13_064990 [Parastagonospora nodorum]